MIPHINDSFVGILFGNPETTSGGNALKFYSTIRVEVRRQTPIKVGEAIVGAKIRAKTQKNKVAPPYRECSMDIYFGDGFCPYIDLINVATSFNVIEKAGGWYSYDSVKLGHGIQEAKKYLMEHKEVYDKIREYIMTEPQFKTLPKKVSNEKE